MITTLRYTFHLFETTITHYTYGFITFPQDPLDCTMKNVCMHIFLFNDLFFLYRFSDTEFWRQEFFKLISRTGHVCVFLKMRSVKIECAVLFLSGVPIRLGFDPRCGAGRQVNFVIAD